MDATEKNCKGDFMLTMIPYLAEVIIAEMPDRVRELRLQAMSRVHQYLRHYEQRGYLPELLAVIAEKKCEKIIRITTKTEMELLIKPRCPHYDGNQFWADDFIIPEEELICWSEASLYAPLGEVGLNRYMELFRQVLPEESRHLPI